MNGSQSGVEPTQNCYFLGYPRPSGTEFNQLVGRVLSKPGADRGHRIGGRMNRKGFTAVRIENSKKGSSVCLDARSYIVKC